MKGVKDRKLFNKRIKMISFSQITTQNGKSILQVVPMDNFGSGDICEF